MPSFRDAMTKRLIDHGCWPDEAKAIIEEVSVAPESSAMEGRWDDDTAGYPDTMKVVLWITVKSRAIKYLERTKPMHFALMVLKGGPPEDEAAPAPGSSSSTTTT